MPRERRALRALVHELRALDMPPLVAVALFGSKARGDFHHRSDLDILVICDVPQRARERAARAVKHRARRIARSFGVDLQPWTVTAEELRPGRRTPMLIDALEDAVPLWPAGIRMRLQFTPRDSRFCAECLLEWWEEGGEIVEQLVHSGRRAAAAARVRDDITRLATAALLLTRETRHRRLSTLRRFDERFVRTEIFSPRVRRALRWAAAAYPPGGGSGPEKPPPTRRAVATLAEGYDAAREMEEEVLPWILTRMRQLPR